MDCVSLNPPLFQSAGIEMTPSAPELQEVPPITCAVCLEEGTTFIGHAGKDWIHGVCQSCFDKCCKELIGPYQCVCCREKIKTRTIVVNPDGTFQEDKKIREKVAILFLAAIVYSAQICAILGFPSKPIGGALLIFEIALLIDALSSPSVLAGLMMCGISGVKDPEGFLGTVIGALGMALALNGIRIKLRTDGVAEACMERISSIKRLGFIVLDAMHDVEEEVKAVIKAKRDVLQDLLQYLIEEEAKTPIGEGRDFLQDALQHWTEKAVRLHNDIAEIPNIIRAL